MSKKKQHKTISQYPREGKSIHQYFQGEQMTCVMCGKVQLSDPGASSDWRAIELDGIGFYACPDHFPPDDGSVEEFAEAYKDFLLKAIKKFIERN